MSNLRQKLWPLLCITFLTIAAGPILAATYVLPEKSGFMGPEGLALGGAIGARENRNDYIFSNPASPAFDKKYTLGARYSTAGDMMGAHIVDSSSSALGGSASYVRRSFKKIDFADDPALGNFNRLENQIAFSLFAKASDTIAIGITGRYHYLKAPTALPAQAYWSGDVGVLIKISPAWNLGLVGQDLLEDDYGYLYRNFVAAIHGSLSSEFKIMGQVDFVRNPEGALDTGFVTDEAVTGFRTGLEYIIQNEFFIRASYAALSSWKANYLGLGLGYKKDSFSLDYAFRSGLGSSKGSIHSVGLSVDI